MKYLLILILGLVGCTTTKPLVIDKTKRTTDINKIIKHGITKLPDKMIQEVKLQTNFDGAKISKRDLKQGCLSKDCIASIENPKFESVSEANWLNDNDRVFVMNFNNIKRAYPQKILNWHEIVNDWYDNIPVAITFCPLCGSAVAFERKVNGVITELGVSGKLHNSDLIMYDRYEGNLWQQITGEGIVGPAARRNETLKQISIFTTTWSEWKTENPNAQVLSRETGFSRDYDRYPYGAYESNDKLLFGINNDNKALQIKTPVIGIKINNSSKAYPESAFTNRLYIEDKLGGNKIKLTKDKSGVISVINLDTNEVIIPIRLFWFAWASFNPDTELFNE